MSDLTIAIGNLEKSAARVAQFLGGQLAENGIGLSVILDGDRGRINFTEFSGGISLVEHNFELSEDWTPTIDNAVNNPLYFFYCLEGKFSYRLATSKKWVTVESYQSLILSSSKTETFDLIFPKGEPLHIFILRIDREVFVKKNHDFTSIQMPLQDYFGTIDPDTQSAHVGSHNLAVAKQFKALRENQNSGLKGRLAAEGHIKIILSLLIGHYETNLGKMPLIGSMKIGELKRVQELSEFIEGNLHMELTIGFLKNRSNLSAAKIQEGFKILYEQTANKFIQDSRLGKAVLLLNDPNMNVSEVAYAVGLNSRSYFSRIFKKEYGLNPKKFQQKLNGTFKLDGTSRLEDPKVS